MAGGLPDEDVLRMMAKSVRNEDTDQDKPKSVPLTKPVVAENEEFPIEGKVDETIKMLCKEHQAPAVFFSQ